MDSKELDRWDVRSAHCLIDTSISYAARSNLLHEGSIQSNPRWKYQAVRYKSTNTTANTLVAQKFFNISCLLLFIIPIPCLIQQSKAKPPDSYYPQDRFQQTKASKESNQLENSGGIATIQKNINTEQESPKRICPTRSLFTCSFVRSAITSIKINKISVLSSHQGHQFNPCRPMR